MIKKIYKSLDSTNKKARLMISHAEERDPFWIRAVEQRKGRGLGSNAWLSEPGKNITASLLIYPVYMRAENQFDISLAASLAVSDLLGLFIEKPLIKWPNDLLAGSGKIAGLLIENALSGQKIEYSVIGIGLNINQENFPPEIPSPTSLKLQTGMDYELEEISGLMLECLLNRLRQLEEGRAQFLKSEYYRNLFRFMEFAPYKAMNSWFRARITGVSRYGQLILETENGEEKKFDFKEVEFID